MICLTRVAAFVTGVSMYGVTTMAHHTSFFGTEDLPPGGKIDAHRHPGSDEILFFQNGRARDSEILKKHTHAVIYREP
jgi:oxalate decarboxylase/phosphoglucose isomerase-like protein (cupin superfamily)